MASKELLKNSVRFFYDLQQLRCQSGSRSSKKSQSAEAKLDADGKKFMDKTSKNLESIEAAALKEVGRLIEDFPIYREFLNNIRGIGPTMAGVLISEINIERCDTVSKLWRWCGLAVVNGRGERPVKGQKLHYNPWLKSKIVKVLTDCLLKSANLDEEGYYYMVPDKDENGRRVEYTVVEDGKEKKKYSMKKVRYTTPPYRKFYDDYKHRKENTIVEKCMGCNGTGKVKRVDREDDVDQGQKKARKDAECPNCNGTGGPAPWGECQQHRHNAAVRYMAKMFLIDLWKKWRELEKLPIRPSYQEEYLGKKHVA